MRRPRLPRLPNGRRDLLRQIVLFCGAYWAYRLVRGIVDGELHRYHHLGDASTQTDNLTYDPTLKPWESEGGRSGTPDDRWVYTEDLPFANYSGIGALAAVPCRVTRQIPTG